MDKQIPTVKCVRYTQRMSKTLVERHPCSGCRMAPASNEISNTKQISDKISLKEADMKITIITEAKRSDNCSLNKTNTQWLAFQTPITKETKWQQREQLRK